MRVYRMKSFRRFQRKEADLLKASQDDLERMISDERLTELSYDQEE